MDWPPSSAVRPPSLISTLNPKSQPGSPFMTRLAPEIRLMIYECIFGYRNLHIFIYEEKLVSLLCKNPTAIGFDGHEICIGMPMYRSPGMDWNSELLQDRPSCREKPYNSSILATCRAIYLESVDILYRKQVLHFSNLISIAVFPRAIIPHHLDVLQHIKLSLALFKRGDIIHAYFNNAFSRNWQGWDEASAAGDTPWQCTWNAIAELRALHTLSVTLEVSPEDHDALWSRSMPADFETLLFQPMRQVVCEDFTVRVNWPCTGNMFEGCPFRLERFGDAERET